MKIGKLQRLLPILGMALCASHAPQALAKTVVLAPSSPWAVNYREEKCELVRAFGEGKNRTTIYLTRYQPGDAFWLMLTGGHARAVPLTRKVNVQFGPAEAPFDVYASRGTVNGDQPAVIFTQSITIAGSEGDQNGDATAQEFDAADPYKIGPKRELAVTKIAFLSNLRNKVHLMSGSLVGPFAALRTCNEQLLAHWGIDVEKHRFLSKQATPIDPGDWLEASDYPTKLLRSGFSGLVTFRLIVEASGEVSQCAIQDATEPEDFGKLTCDIIKSRAKFEPALDANGQPIRSYWASSAHWQIVS